MTMIQEYLAGVITLTDSELAVADVTGDGKVKVSDATMIQKYVAELFSFSMYPRKSGPTYTSKAFLLTTTAAKRWLVFL